MTNPPEVETYRTETQKLEDTITTAMNDLTRDWPHMIRNGETQAPGIASRSGVLLDDHDPRDADQNRITKTLSLRRLAQDQLNAWCRLIIEDRPVTNTATTPSGRDVPAMAAFIRRHADWISGHETAQDCADEVRTLARACHTIVSPQRKEWMSLGACPLEVEFDPAVGVEVCGGDVRAWPAPLNQTRDEQAHAKLPECRRCGTEATVEWWQAHIIGDPSASPLVTTDDLISVIAWSLNWVVSHDQIRQWKTRQKIVAEGRDSKGRTLYRHAEVVEAIRADVAKQQAKTR